MEALEVASYPEDLVEALEDDAGVVDDGGGLLEVPWEVFEAFPWVRNEDRRKGVVDGIPYPRGVVPHVNVVGHEVTLLHQEVDGSSVDSSTVGDSHDLAGAKRLENPLRTLGLMS